MNRYLTAFIAACLALSFAPALSAQEAPAPRRMPRTPVNQQALASRHDSVMQTRQVQGQATIFDGEKLRIGEVELRLFGIVPPQLSASFGPQARAVLDNLTSGQNIQCQIRDRDHDGRFLATCRNAANNDLAMELLKRGLAVSARGSLTGSELATPYLVAEQAAQQQKTGLWSVNSPSPINLPATAISPIPAMTVIEIPKTELVKPDTAAPFGGFSLTDAKKVDKASVNPEKSSDALPNPITKTPSTGLPAQRPVIIVPPLMTVDSAEPVTVRSAAPGLIERFQLLITGLVMLATALSLLAILTTRHRAERRDELRAIAAALRGELMAARGVCLSRAKAITSEAEDRALIWPRLRSTLYQAYVGRLGFLGAELARQVASIYGQSSDYTLYYNSDTGRTDPSPKRQALLNLVTYIDEVMPKLALIEQSGTLLESFRRLGATALPTPAVEALVQARAAARPSRPTVVQRQSAAAKVLSTLSTLSPVDGAATATQMKNVRRETTAAKPEPSALPPVITPHIGVTSAATTAYAASLQAPKQLWEAVRNFARDHMPERHTAPLDDSASDYTRMIEEEMSNYSFEETDADLHDQTVASYTSKLRDTGS